MAAGSDTMADHAPDHHHNRRTCLGPRVPAAQAPRAGAGVRRVGGDGARVLPGGGGASGRPPRCCSRSIPLVSFAAVRGRRRGVRTRAVRERPSVRCLEHARGRDQGGVPHRAHRSLRQPPGLADSALPLELRVPALPAGAGSSWPGGSSSRSAGRSPPSRGRSTRPSGWGESRYLDVRLAGTVRLADALNHLYVLLPVLDDAKHYWVTRTRWTSSSARAATGSPGTRRRS